MGRSDFNGISIVKLDEKTSNLQIFDLYGKMSSFYVEFTASDGVEACRRDTKVYSTAKQISKFYYSSLEV